MHVHKSLIRPDDDGEYVTILIREIPDAIEAVERVRELLNRWNDDDLDCACFDAAIEDLTEALKGE